MPRPPPSNDADKGTSNEDDGMGGGILCQPLPIGGGIKPPLVAGSTQVCAVGLGEFCRVSECGRVGGHHSGMSSSSQRLLVWFTPPLFPAVL